ncbi:MAG: hypothetical protein VX090_01375, partial [Pseudomonadota bacterium]|nr:hypothetical protein [Pseudomonadota bacterium]
VLAECVSNAVSLHVFNGHVGPLNDVQHDRGQIVLRMGCELNFETLYPSCHQFEILRRSDRDTGDVLYRERGRL